MIERVDGVIISADEVRVLVDALGVFRAVVRGQGARPTARLESLHTRLRAALGTPKTDADVRETYARVSDPTGNAGRGSSFGHDVVDTATAAQLLGTSAANARDLARRGVVPAVRVGGRWIFDRRGVLGRAAARD